MPPRAKPGQSAVQWQELDDDGVTTVVHPLRTLFPMGRPSQESKLEMQTISAAVEAGRIYKWTVSRNGALSVGPATVTPQEWPRAGSGQRRAEYLGHTTLIGGLAEPFGRIAGEWRRTEPQDGKPRAVIDNNSGRYGEFKHLEPRHLERVRQRFEELGCPVASEWIDMSARKLARQAEKAARSAASRVPAQPSGVTGA